MGNLWLKIKIWSKIGSLSLLLIYLLIFVIANNGEAVKVWFWFGYRTDTTVLRLIAFMLASGIIGTLLVRTAFSTIRQVRDLRNRNRHLQMEKDMVNLRAKADMLQTKPQNPTEEKIPLD
jgi:uncharacterized integral membrane protein